MSSCTGQMDCSANYCCCQLEASCCRDCTAFPQLSSRQRGRLTKRQSPAGVRTLVSETRGRGSQNENARKAWTRTNYQRHNFSRTDAHAFCTKVTPTWCTSTGPRTSRRGDSRGGGGIGQVTVVPLEQFHFVGRKKVGHALRQESPYLEKRKCANTHAAVHEEGTAEWQQGRRP